MKNIFSSIFASSTEQLFHRDIFPIFIVHLALTALLAGTITFYFYNYMAASADEGATYLSNLLSYEGFFSTIASVLVLVLSWLMFTSILIPISSITGLIFEDEIMKKVLIIGKSNLELNRNHMSLLSFLFFVSKNLFFYLFFNLLALPFYFLLPPPLNILIFIAINGYLLGIQAFHGIILSYYDEAQIYRSLSKNRINLFIIGSILTSAFLVPVLNLFAPLLTILALINYFILVND